MYLSLELATNLSCNQLLCEEHIKIIIPLDLPYLPLFSTSSLSKCPS